ncbi:MAG: hypothetical protein R6W71_13135 [Bacteroidales bacterium]|jgi:hypothetical protein
MTKVFYKEEQKFNQWWIWLLIFFLTGIWLWQLVQQIFLGIPFGNNPTPDYVVWLTGLFPLLVIILFRVLSLETIINKNGVHYRFIPFQRKAKVIKPTEISGFEVKQYKPLKEYGGWGIRTGFGKRSSAYNVSGNQGALFHLKNGKKFLLGTQNPASIRSALEKMMRREEIFR